MFRRLTGNIVFPGFTAPKLVWVARHEPRAIRDRVAKVLLPKDYLRLWLTGEHVGEMSDAAGTSLAGYRQARLVGRPAGRDRP
jgi:xylulokinase